MKKFNRTVQIIFGVPWIIFGIQHFLYANFVAGLVPAYFPAKLFWVYLTGAAMIAAGIAFITNIRARLAAVLLGVMLLLFVLLIHISTITNDASAINWTRALQDTALAAAAFMLAGTLSKRESRDDFIDKIAFSSRYLFSILLIVFGIEQFMNLDFLTAKVAPYLPLRMIWVYLTGAAMIITGVCVIINRKVGFAALSLATLMLLLNLLLYVYLLANELHNPVYWTAAMLNLAITCGVFILANVKARENND